MPTNPETGRYEEPVYQLENRQGQPGTYPKMDGDGDVLNSAGDKLATRAELEAVAAAGTGGGTAASYDGDHLVFDDAASSTSYDGSHLTITT